MIRAVFSALLSHWLKSPLQALALLGGLALATALWSGVQAINAEARQSYARAAATVSEGDYAQIRGALTLSDFVALRRAGVLVSPIIEGRLNGVRIIGVDVLTSPTLTAFPTENLGEIEGPAFYGTAEALALVDLAPDIGKVTVEGAAPNTVYADISLVADLLDRGTEIDRLILLKDQPVGAASPEKLGYKVTPAQAGTDLAKLTDSFHLNLTAFGLLSFAVGIFIVHSAIGLAFEQRKPMIRTLRAVGVPLQTLIGLMVTELVGLATVAGGIGVCLGYLVAAALLPDVAATLRGLYGASIEGTLSLSPIWWLGGVVVSIVGALIASLGVFLKLWQMPLLAAAQARNWQTNGPLRRFRLGAVILCACLGLGILLFGKGLVAGFVLLGALLIGAALLLPSVLALVLSLGQRTASGVLTQWFWADTRQQASGLSLALSALLLAMAANVGVATMVSSFRVTFVQFLDQRLAPELYIYAETEDEAERIERFVEPLVDVVLPLVYQDTVVSGVPTEIYGAKNHSTYPDNWRLIEASQDPWGQVAGGSVLVNEQFARRTDQWTGAEIEIEGRTFTVAGVYGDYGNPVGQIVMTQTVFSEVYPDNRALRFGLRVDPDKVQDVSDALRDFGLSDDQIINQAAIKSLSKGIFEQTFVVTDALNILTLAVAGFAILMSLLTLATMRLPQLAPIWALGLTRKRLARFEILRALIFALITSAAAIPLGLVLAWVLLAVVNVEAFGWKLPLYFFPLDYLKLVIEALIAAVIASLIPAMRLGKTSPSQMLKVFANER